MRGNENRFRRSLLEKRQVAEKTLKTRKSEKLAARRYTNRDNRRQTSRSGSVQPVKIPASKWEHISIVERNMDSSRRPCHPASGTGFSQTRFFLRVFIAAQP